MEQTRVRGRWHFAGRLALKCARRRRIAVLFGHRAREDQASLFGLYPQFFHQRCRALVLTDELVVFWESSLRLFHAKARPSDVIKPPPYGSANRAFLSLRF